jgi:hypothetical protein
MPHASLETSLIVRIFDVSMASYNFLSGRSFIDHVVHNFNVVPAMTHAPLKAVIFKLIIQAVTMMRLLHSGRSFIHHMIHHCDVMLAMANSPFQATILEGVVLIVAMLTWSIFVAFSWRHSQGQMVLCTDVASSMANTAVQAILEIVVPLVTMESWRLLCSYTKIAEVVYRLD